MTLIDKAEALAPCPFCGGAAFCSEYGDGRVIIGCGNDACPAEASICDTPAAAIAAWNRRAIPARGVGVPEAMRQMIVQAVSFANRAAGEGICIDDLEPETFLFNYSQATGDEDWATLPARILAALAPTDAAQAREAALHPDDMLPEAIRLIRQEASRDHSQEVVTGLKHIALLLEQLIKEART